MLDFIEEKNKDEYLVIFLHGWGSDKYDLMPLKNSFKSVSNNIHFISVNAPFPCESGFGYQWFSLKEISFNTENHKDVERIQKEIRNNNLILKEFIDFQSKRLGINYDKIFLVGFSQGSIMALYTGITMSEQLAGIIAFSGLFPVLLDDIKSILRSKQKILMIHGENDRVIPPDFFHYSVDILKKFDFDFSYKLLENLDHSINEEGIELAKNFINNIIKK